MGFDLNYGRIDVSPHPGLGRLETEIENRRDRSQLMKYLTGYTTKL
jgi:Zn-dependent M32 family carboxypeptidase